METIQQLQKQSAEHYAAVKELRRGIGRLEAAVFGNGNPDGAIMRRLKNLEESMGEFHDYVTREMTARETRQNEIDKRDRMQAKKLNMLLAVVSVMTLVVPLLTLAVDKLL